MTLSRNEKQIQTRQHLIDAGFALISEYGYNAVSIRNLSKQAGYTQGAFYSNFSSKEEFLLELMQLQFAKENLQLQEIFTSAPSNTEQLIDSLRKWLTVFFTDDEWLKISIELQLFAARDITFAEEYQKVWKTHQQEVTKIMKHFFSLVPMVKPDDYDSIVIELVSLSYGLALQYMIFKDDIDHYINIFINTLVKRLGNF
ncbi:MULTISPECIES: TetR/AcrR family transcriptional regulator [Acinetobacter]|uniref:TetR/AcrR family transcriptional regulator n=1 Tax=Acinetobacter pittii TaxID=48296 RepID=A0AAE8G9K1_ACIPI|nr:MULTISPECIES: TetR/AcrR family transcriptional regulator [Acinetobacter]MDS7925433.1 TetR/AcrR family transcriptional regulator [Acinetobacter sp. V115_6]RZH30024.1 TetR/AcrR family transcriptional regulator [Acinetobacter pittii]